MFWVISVYFNIRNTLPKSGTFLLGHSVFIDFPEHLHESLKDKIPLMLFCLLKVAASLIELKDEGKWLSIRLLL